MSARRWFEGITTRDVAIVAFVYAFEMASTADWDESAPVSQLSDSMVLAIAASGTLALLWRRQAPVVTFGVVTAFTVACAALLGPVYPPVLPPLVALFAVAAHRDLRTSLVALAVAALPALSYSVVAIDVMEVRGRTMVTIVLVLAIVYIAAWALGRVAQAHRAEVVDLEARRREAIAEERTRLARELHDVVSHAVSVIVLQAAGAQTLVERDPRRTAAALAHIEASGREAMNELRRMLGILRVGDAPTEVHLGDHHLIEVDEVVERVRSAGASVELTVEGTPSRLDPSIDHTAYRVVQESLTNALKHGGGEEADVEVRITWGDQLTVEVSNRLSADADGAADGSAVEGTGLGLLGLHERIAMLGGAFEAGEGHDAAFRVRAVLPVADGGTSEATDQTLVT